MASNNNNLPAFPRIFTTTLAANAILPLEVGQASSLFLYSNTGAAGSISIAFENQQAFLPLVGQIIKSNVPFTRVVIQNTTNNSLTYTIVVSNGDIDFKGLVISSGLGVQDVATIIKTYAAGTTLALNTKRKRAWAWNNTAGALVIGDASVSATQGIPIAAGQVIILETTALLTATGNITWTEENYS